MYVEKLKVCVEYRDRVESQRCGVWRLELGMWGKRGGERNFVG